MRTSGCAQGTVFGDLMDETEGVELSKAARLTTSWLCALQKRSILRDRSHVGKRFVALSGEERILYDQDVNPIEHEDARRRRKGSEE